MNTDRNLTEQDVEAILDAFEQRFYKNLGKGVWAATWKVIILALIGVAAYGSYVKH